MRYTIIAIAIHLALTAGLTAAGVLADVIQVSGDQTGTWLATNTYEVVGTVIVPETGTLEIGAGTEIRFMGDYSLQVEGGLTALGEAGNEIVFASGQPEPAPGDWYGILFSVSDASNELRHCRIEFAHNGVGALTSDDLILDSVHIFHSGNWAMVLQEASPVITNCVLARSQAGGLSCYLSSPVVEGCTMAENDTWGATAAFGSNLTLNETIIVGNGESAIYCGEFSSADLLCCNLFGNQGGDWADCIADQAGIVGNFSEDPRFCGIPDSGNYYLRSDSPCAPGNHPDQALCDLIGGLPIGCDEMATRTSSWSAIKHRY